MEVFEALASASPPLVQEEVEVINDVNRARLTALFSRFKFKLDNGVLSGLIEAIAHAAEDFDAVDFSLGVEPEPQAHGTLNAGLTGLFRVGEFKFREDGRLFIHL